MAQPNPCDEKTISAAPAPLPKISAGDGARAGLLAAALVAVYAPVFVDLYLAWTGVGSYYLHGFLIPPISLYFVWQKRRELQAAPLRRTWAGVVLVGLACLMLLAGQAIGIRIAGQVSLLVMITGLILAFLGPRHAALVWFPILFLLMMIPIPMSVVQSVALHIKLFATQMAVVLAQLCMLPVIREGSYVYFGEDHFIIGEVCGGLRSLISLLSVGAVVAYISNTRSWARWLLFAASGPIAVIANIVRIFLLCVAGFFWGSQTATGKFHDISGIVIFLVAFLLLFSLDSLLRRLAPKEVQS